MYFQLVIVVILLARTTYQECTNEIGGGGFTCTSFNDLQNIPIEIDNISITPKGFQNIANRIQGDRKPSLQLSLTDVGNSISESNLAKLKDISSLFGDFQLGTIKSNFFSNGPFKIVTLDKGQISNIEVGAFSNSSDLTEISITNHHLTNVGFGVFSDLPITKLTLSKNEIRNIDRDAFTNMKRLKILHLGNNELVEFQPEVLFNKAETLEQLWLNGNLLTDLDRNLIRGLTNLRVLNLANNKITRISRYTFDYLLKLEKLSLANNLVTELDGSVFPEDGLPRLSTLHIGGNRLTFLNSAALEKLKSVKELSFGGNPWQCPCNDIILEWMAEHDVDQVCDKAYSDGSNPVCIVDEAHPTTCVYRVTPIGISWESIEIHCEL